MNTQDYENMASKLDDDTLDNHRNAPKPDPACLYGLVGDVARAGAENTEANPYAIAANFIAYMSAALGRVPGTAANIAKRKRKMEKRLHERGYSLTHARSIVAKYFAAK